MRSIKLCSLSIPDRDLNGDVTVERTAHPLQLFLPYRYLCHDAMAEQTSSVILYFIERTEKRERNREKTGEDTSQAVRGYQ
jgi:hypothetical protein